MNFINKINKYLLENYPLIWNTRLVWMLGVTFLVHILFFIIGYSAANELNDLKDHYNLSSFYEDNAVYYNVLISIFILLIWIVFYLRNNAFKNIYQVSKGFLFKQFLLILIIFFLSISQYFSFKQGLVTKIKSDFDWEQIDADIKTFNKSGLFLVQNQADYQITEKKYPEPFPLEVAYADKNNFEDNIDSTRAYIKFEGSYYQFYKINPKFYQDKNEDFYVDERVFLEDVEVDFSIRDVKDVSAFKEFIKPSLFNYSKELFHSGQDSLAYEDQLKNHQKILENKDESEIKIALKNFLELADKYEISHNLDVDRWFELINYQPNYFLKELINTSPPNAYRTSSSTKSRYYDDIPFSETLYVELKNTNYLFSNIHEAYFINSKIEVLFVYLYCAFILALLLFIFKTTNLKNIILAIVASLVLIILIVWLMSATKNLSINSEYRAYILMTFMSFLVLLISFVSYQLYWKKIVISISWSLALFASPIFFLFSCLTIIRYLHQQHLDLYPKEYDYQSDFEIWFSKFGFWAILLISFLTVYLYSVYIRKLKARPA